MIGLVVGFSFVQWNGNCKEHHLCSTIVVLLGIDTIQSLFLASVQGLWMIRFPEVIL